MKTVAIAMSGGVDSSVAAALLLKQGYRVIGLTMKLWRDESFPASTVAEEDAAKVAAILGIEHHVLDFTQEFRATVVDYFLEEYAQARTPNPCVYCNQKIKFGALYQAARELGADYLATGHYVRLAATEQGLSFIRQAANLPKDQSYVLYHLNQEILSHVLFPLGEYDKPQVRQLAEEMQLPVFNKKDSQEICFIPDDNHHRFLQCYGSTQEQPGNFVDSAGNILGQHRGLAHYTVGQRKGLGLAAPAPLFVLRLDAQRNEVVLGYAAEAMSRGLVAQEVVWASGVAPQDQLQVTVKIRYNARPLAATVRMLSATAAEVSFAEPCRAPAPGQAVVFYDGELCLGGGIIERGLAVLENKAGQEL